MSPRETPIGDPQSAGGRIGGRGGRTTDGGAAVEDELMDAIDMAAEGKPLGSHLSARLSRTATA